MTRWAIALSLAGASLLGPGVLAQGARGTIAGHRTTTRARAHRRRPRPGQATMRSTGATESRTLSMSVPQAPMKSPHALCPYRSKAERQGRRTGRLSRSTSASTRQRCLFGDDAAFVVISKRYSVEGPLPRAANGKA